MNKRTAFIVTFVTLFASEASAFMPESEPIDVAQWGVEPTRYFLVGVAFERGDDTIIGDDLLGDQLIGATVMYRAGDVGFGGRLLLSPKFERSSFLEIRGQLGLDARYYFTYGLDWSVGLGVSAEARLADHLWLAYANLLEIGATVYSSRTLSVRLFGGVRYAFGGNLVNWFLVDPNGFDNENAADDLKEELDAPFEGFVRLVFQRRIE